MLSGIIIFIVVSVFFVFAAKLFPGKPPLSIKTTDITEIRKKFRKIELLSALGFFVITPIIIYLLTIGMISVQSIYLNLNKTDALYVIGVTGWIFAVPAIFMGILMYVIVLNCAIILIIRILLKNEEEYKVFEYDWNKRLAFGNDIDSNKLFLICNIFIIPLFFIMFGLGVDNYSKITDTHIIDNGYFSLQEKQYQYSDIAKILYITKYKNARSGDVKKTGPHYSVLMKDGYNWITLNLTINKSSKEVEIISFISQKSGIPIIEGVHNIDDELY